MPGRGVSGLKVNADKSEDKSEDLSEDFCYAAPPFTTCKKACFPQGLADEDCLYLLLQRCFLGPPRPHGAEINTRPRCWPWWWEGPVCYHLTRWLRPVLVQSCNQVFHFFLHHFSLWLKKKKNVSYFQLLGNEKVKQASCWTDWASAIYHFLLN